MKTRNIKLGVLAAIIAPFLMGCPKSKPAVAPDPDTDLQSSIDASFATFVVTDIEMMCSFAGENDLTPDFYMPQPGENPLNTNVIRDISADQIVITFNQSRGLDGRLREGSIFMNYGNDNPNAKYYRDYEFYGRFTLSEFKVDGWLVKTVNGVPCKIYNRLTSPVYDPSKTNLTWLIDGSFEFTHPTDPSKNMVWTGKLTKTLVNTSDPSVFHPSRQQAINWSKAIVEYKGEATGITSANVPYNMTINYAHPLTRDFGCYSEVVGGLSSIAPVKAWKQEFHPIKSGIVSFTTGDKYPREIYYGNEWDTNLPEQCDNSGIVMIKGISSRVDFMK